MSKRSLSVAALAASCIVSLASAAAQLPQPDGGTIERGTLPARWLSEGGRCMEIPPWQIHEYNKDLYILRQSPCTDYEKPFIFLIFGKERALLVDTGSRNGNLAPALLRTVKDWLAMNHRAQIPLTVVHTHPHEDHTAGDADLQALHDPAVPITFVPAELEPTQNLYGIATWPTDIGHIDLGGRVLDIIPIPGHSALSVAFYDRTTAILLAGDSLYPGRLYVADFAAFQASTERLIAFTAGKPVAEVLGNHIEQTDTPYLDYPVGTIYQPNEHPLALSRGSLLELEDALVSMHGKPRRMALRDFSVWPVGHDFMSSAEAAQFKKHRAEELAHMWNNAPQ